MPSRIRIFDHFCRPLAEISAATTPRSWILNGYGRCEFSISTADPKCTETNMQFGNLVYIEHIPSKDADGNTNGQLPPWVGMILPPRNWDFGVLHMSAYSAEAILAFRAMPWVTVTGTPSEVFAKLLEFSNAAAGNIIIHPGTIDDAPGLYPDDLRLSAYDHVGTLVKTAGMYWDITGEIDPRGNLQLFGNLYAKKGITTSLVLSNLNTELSSPLLTEQGTPSNQVFGYSQASTKQQRCTAEGRNQGAMDDYGPLQANKTFMGKHDPASVLAAAQALADTRGRPVKIVHRIALDRKDTFDHLETGNILTLRDTSVGFAPGGGFGMTAQVRILSMDYNDLSNKAPLNVEVVE